MLHTYARDIWSDRIVFRDELAAALPANGAVLRQATSNREIRQSIDERAGAADWLLLMDGGPAGKGIRS